jgi:beta-glucosidase
MTRTGSLTVSVDVKNTGARSGKEVVQLYVSDLYREVSPPNRELKDFAKIELQPGETRTVSFTLRPADLRFVGLNNKWKVEPGDFKVRVGQLEKQFTLK